ncbi:MAG TPA: NADH-ubiquinone oxidoreductase-F iron-sulfur binding region domain-containing protein [Candidatus Limnocylindrales bacterium]|nr:NADH-ubiquinone oxidoreductase-F iron-sulfur binding region domain-containing protein [Candidatus Limnocylindrales bacterium]
MITSAPADRLLAGPPLTGEAESYDAHRARLGPLPPTYANGDLITTLESSGLLGRGGAGFPVGRKWRSMASRKAGRAVIVANGAEGEPPSFKDRTLMANRPHLVLDGAALAAEAVDADEIVLYVGEEHEAAVAAMRRAMRERRVDIRRPMRLVEAPIGYVAGEASAAVHAINAGDARPTTTPPRMSQSGVGGHPTLVQNVESLAAVALIARHGDDWYRSAGRLASKGTALVTVTGQLGAQGVREIELGTSLGEVVEATGGRREDLSAVVLGGYFGTWTGIDEAWDLPLDPAAMHEAGLTFGCGIVGVLGVGSCGVAATAEILAFMARESAGQCGPCVYGLGAIAEAIRRIAHGAGTDQDQDNLVRWAALVSGRGACHHPDGAIQLLMSALHAFGPEIDYHVRTKRCSITKARQGHGQG